MRARPSPMDMALRGVRSGNADAVLPVLGHVITGSGRRRRWSPRRPDFDVHIIEQPLEPGGQVTDALQRVLRLPLPAGAPPWDIHIL